MDDESTATSPRLRLSARRSIEAVLDRIEARLQDADDGFHRIGAAASRRELDGSGLPPEAQLLWERWDGLDLACSEAIILCLQDLSPATDLALSEGRISVGDRVIGERGRDLFVLAADPFAEGADVILVEEDGGRQPHSTRTESFARNSTAMTANSCRRLSVACSAVISISTRTRRSLVSVWRSRFGALASFGLRPRSWGSCIVGLLILPGATTNAAALRCSWVIAVARRGRLMPLLRLPRGLR